MPRFVYVGMWPPVLQKEMAGPTEVNLLTSALCALPRRARDAAAWSFGKLPLVRLLTDKTAFTPSWFFCHWQLCCSCAAGPDGPAVAVGAQLEEHAG